MKSQQSCEIQRTLRRLASSTTNISQSLWGSKWVLGRSPGDPQGGPEKSQGFQGVPWELLGPKVHKKQACRVPEYMHVAPGDMGTQGISVMSICTLWNRIEKPCGRCMGAGAPQAFHRGTSGPSQITGGRQCVPRGDPWGSPGVPGRCPGDPQGVSGKSP